MSRPSSLASDRPVLLVQLSDSHLFAEEDGKLLGMDTCDSLAKVIERVQTEQPQIDLILLSQKGSLFITRPTIMSYTAKRADLLELGGELFAVVASGQVRIEVNQRYALKDAAQAHRDLEARKTTGSTILLP